MSDAFVLGRAATVRIRMVSALCRESYFINLFTGYMWPKELKIILGSLYWILHLP
jgi:hypothetical protein